MKPKAFFVVSAWKNDIRWVYTYTDQYLVYDKGNTLYEHEKILKPENVGFNIWDQFDYIINHYDNLPEVVAFLEGNPFDHCKQETFDKLIYNEVFTPIEDYSHIPESAAHKKSVTGGYMEINTSWYLYVGMQDPKYKHKYFHSYDDFMNKMFSDYQHIDWLRFSPGGQYIVPRERILNYSLDFWKELRAYVSYDQYPTEAYLIERALYYIYTNEYEEKK